MTSGPDFLADAAGELVAAATRLQRQRRTQRRAATGAAAVMVVAIGALITFGALRSGDADAEHLTIAPNADGWQVTMIDATASGPDLVKELTDAGIRVERIDRYVGPSKVGKVLNTTLAGYGTSGTLTIPAGSPVIIEVGVTTPKGREYEQPSQGFEAGEPLHCLGAIGGDATALANRIPADVDVSWFRGLGDSSPITQDDLAGTIVQGAISLKANSVRINVVDGADPAEPPAC